MQITPSMTWAALALMAGPSAALGADARTQAVLDSIMSETASYSLKTLDKLTADQRARLDKGEAVIVGGDIRDSQGRTLEKGKRADTFVILDLPPAVTFAVLTDLNHYSTTFADVTTSKILHTQTSGAERQDYYYQVVDLPAITDPVGYMLIHSRKDDTDGDGVPDAFAIWWHNDDTYTVKDEDGEIIQPNLTINSGAWKILPWEGGARSLVFYSLIQVPGFYVPDLAWDKATTWLGIPKVLSEVGKAGKSGRYGG